MSYEPLLGVQTIWLQCQRETQQGGGQHILIITLFSPPVTRPRAFDTPPAAPSPLFFVFLNPALTCVCLPGCTPQRCGRAVTDSVVTREEAQVLRRWAPFVLRCLSPSLRLSPITHGAFLSPDWQAGREGAVARRVRWRSEYNAEENLLFVVNRDRFRFTRSEARSFVLCVSSDWFSAVRS